jgi:hypothetical protein
VCLHAYQPGGRRGLLNSGNTSLRKEILEVSGFPKSFKEPFVLSGIHYQLEAEACGSSASTYRQELRCHILPNLLHACSPFRRARFTGRIT